ncbi:trigger factor-like [Bradysia coprophila]|uniref:trigger factor-like n=1 Tax=Bradysia coprophila TaxID=38358 RepID=UPI00187DBB61|nr:trigger factor-like [Bradysia coprophila]
MMRSHKILLIFGLCPIILTSASPFFKTLLTTTETPTHISDFRNLPRSDSRAIKPDIFPGFDFLDEPTTMRPKTPLDFYGKVIGGLVNRGRQTYERIVNNLQKFEINRRASLSQKLEYLPVVQRIVATTESVPESTEFFDEKFKSSKEHNWPKKYFSSILTAVALNKLRNASDPEYLSKVVGATATYINPLLNVWKRATLQLNFRRNTTVLYQQKHNNDTISNITYPSPTLQQPTNESIGVTNLVSNPSSSLGFRYAFSKYLNLISKGYGDADENETIAELSDGVPSGDVNLNNNNTMGVNAVAFPIERIDERNDDDDDADDDDIQANDDNDDELNENGNDDNFGIFILEIFGTIAGLTWGAFSQLQNLFAQNGKMANE